MLFDEGGRPNAAELAETIAGLHNIAVSHDIGTGAEGSADREAPFEIVSDGLTFDVQGLRPSPSISLPPSMIDSISAETRVGSDQEACVLVPGPHLTGGTYILPILRGLLTLGADLSAALPAVCAIAWPSSHSLMETKAFRAQVAAWANGGAFPSAFLTSFVGIDDGSLESRGLCVFTGQELRLEPILAQSTDVATRLGQRLIEQLVLLGKIDWVEELTGPDGAMLRLCPSEDGKIISVARG